MQAVKRVLKVVGRCPKCGELADYERRANGQKVIYCERDGYVGRKRSDLPARRVWRG